MAVIVNSSTGEARFTLDPAGSIATEVQLPLWTRRVTVYAETNDVRVSRTGSDGGLIGPHYAIVGAQVAHSRVIQYPPDRATKRSIFVDSTVAAAVAVSVICEPESNSNG